MRILIALAVVAGFAQAVGAPVLLKPAFSLARGIADWEPDGNGRWVMRDGFLRLDQAGVPGGTIRKPAGMAILRSAPITNFSLEVDLRSDAPVDLLVRDVEVIFGYRSTTEFYYVHLAAKTDAVHTGIFLVNNADRKRLDDGKATPRLMDQAWHRVRVERDTTSGAIRVFFDRDTTPMLTAVDRTLTAGRVGVGSFDETGEFNNLEVRTLSGH
jgi:hypothetical protein